MRTTHSAGRRSGDSRPTLLIMDNDRMALAAMRTVLTQALPDVDVLPPVTEGVQAIRRCTDVDSAPAVLLADISMNDINAPAVARAIRRENGTTAILAITASIVERHARDMADAGAQGIVSKNSDVRLQALAIHTVMEGGTWPDESGTPFQTAAEAHRRIASEPDTALSAREIEVLDRWSQGLSSEDIAHELEISPTTVRTHLARAKDKLGAHNLRELIGIWIRMNSH